VVARAFETHQAGTLQSPALLLDRFLKENIHTNERIGIYVIFQHGHEDAAVAAAVTLGLHVTQDPFACAWLILNDPTITHALRQSFHHAERHALHLHRCDMLGAVRTSTTLFLHSMYTGVITMMLDSTYTGVLTTIHSMRIFGSYIGSRFCAAHYVLVKSGSSALGTLQWGFILLSGIISTTGWFLVNILAFF
jgi:hypothetical protein